METTNLSDREMCHIRGNNFLTFLEKETYTLGFKL